MRRRIIPTAELDPRHSDEHYDEFVIQWPGKPGRTWGKTYRAHIFKQTGRVEVLTAAKRQPVRLVQRNRIIDAINSALFNYRTAQARKAAETTAFRGQTVADPVGCDMPNPAHEARAEAALTARQPLKPGERRLIGVIDCTPAWRALLPGLLAALEDGTANARQIAREELERMALAADAYVAISKKGVE